MAPETKTSDRRTRLAALAVIYVVAAAVGYVLGARGLLPYGPLRTSTSTPAARVGLALRDGTAHADPASLALLKSDVDSVRGTLGAPERDAFDLVTALRGVGNAGKVDAAAAERSCNALKLARCDVRALEVIQTRSRP